MKDPFVIHVSNWNFQDRVITVPRAEALAILKDKSIAPNDRCSKVWDLAVEADTILHDPRVSEMDEAELFISWNMVDAGKRELDSWEKDLQYEIAELEEQWAEEVDG